MSEADKPLSPDEVQTARTRRLEAMAMQEIEANPFSGDDIALFEMFEREAWSHEKRRAYLLDLARKDTGKGGS